MTFHPRIHENGNPCCSSYTNNDGTGDYVRPPTFCTLCEAHFSALEAPALRTLEEEPEHITKEHTMSTIPNAYGPAIKQLRAAAGLTAYDEAMAEQKKAIRQSANDIAATNAERRRAMGARDLSAYAPPDPYAAGIRALQERQK